MIPFPSSTVVPRMTMLSAYVASLWKCASSVVFDVEGSPVSDDSLINREVASNNLPSAGTSSPVSNNTTSPTTTSFRGTSHTCSLRITLTALSSFTVLSKSNLRLASYSKAKPTPVARRIAAMIPIVSAYSFSKMEITSDKQAATSKMRITGSSNFSRYSFQIGLRLGGVSTFTPYFSLLCCTSISVSPLNIRLLFVILLFLCKKSDVKLHN